MRRLALTALALLPFAASSQPPQANGADFAELDRWIRRRAEADSFSGAVIIAKDGVPLLRAGYGLADRDTRQAITPETKFNLGSIDKLITRIALWQLVAAGKLALDVPIGRYLPDFPNAQVRDKVTARQLYEMRSGVGGFFGDEYLRRHAEIRSVDDYLTLFASNPLEFEPGTSMLYSNGGYIILGKLIERLSGKSYYDYVIENITGPLGMTGTRHYLIDERVKDRAIGYTRTRGEIQANTYSLAGKSSPAGGGYSTVDDFLRLDAALRAGRLIPRAFGDSILAPSFARGDVVSYGGGGPGTNTHYASFADGYTIIVFGNMDPPLTTEVAQAAAKALGKALPGGTRVLRRPGD
jgi:D-alanyl-D-alanine carboxypeptidase